MRRFQAVLIVVSLLLAAPIQAVLLVAEDVAEQHRKDVERIAAWGDRCEPSPGREAIDRLAAWVQVHPDDAQSCHWLAVAYMSHLEGVDRPAGEIVELLKRAAAQSHPAAMAELRRRMLQGEGLPKDVPQGVRLIRSAAAKQDARAMFALARLLALGADGVEKDRKGALEWFQRSADAGYVRALVFLAAALDEAGKPDAALRALQDGAERGDFRAQLALSVWYHRGHNTPVDLAKSFQWAKRAAEANPDYTDAQVRVGLLYLTGDGVSQDLKMARVWLSKAAAAGDAKAKELLRQLDTDGE